jgi:hypothetical protein
MKTKKNKDKKYAGELYTNVEKISMTWNKKTKIEFHLHMEII